MDIQIYQAFIKSPIGFWTCKTNENQVLSISYTKEQPLTENPENHLSKEAMHQLQAYFAKKLQKFDLPLHIESYSAFYQQVWGALLTVKYGQTSTYSSLAQKINNPKAVRAVGLANGRNPFPIVILCHRIIGKNNSLTGYASGIDVKRWLLEHEGAIGKQARLFQL